MGEKLRHQASTGDWIFQLAFRHLSTSPKAVSSKASS